MTKPRSIDQHKRFFAVVKAAFDNWPHAHKFQPDNAEHLRAWLLVRAGHHTVKTFYLSDEAAEYARLIPVIVQTMLHKHAWCRAEGNKLDVCVPLSIAIHGEHAIGHQLFCKINDDVDEIIRAETGLDPEALLRERAA